MGPPSQAIQEARQVSIPEEVRRRLRETGRRFDDQAIQEAHALFAALHEAHGYTADRITRDLAYGEHPRHRLDVHAPAGADGAPVLLFVHGGGFVRGDKSLPGMPFYEHLGKWAADRGLVAVTITHRLAPRHRWPSGAEDVAAAVSWTRENVAGYGGDPERVVVMGQSAGGAHVANYLAGHGGPVAGNVIGGVLLSGVYDPATAEPNVRLRSYYGDDPSAYPDRSSLKGLVASQVPLLIGVAEWDMPDFHRQAAILLNAMVEARGVFPPFVTVQEATHLSEILDLGLDDTGFGGPLARFLGRVVGQLDGVRPLWS